ncbi:hypothetical protein LTR94_025770 [Friedmanniomyces endolithicus]|nr:hypothetical protein LTR94_025770 [Friedmanniomyces endolithicus]
MIEADRQLAFERLTPREREILRLVAQHRRSKEIARLLALSPKTVEMHVLSARRRLAGMNRRDAALAFVAWEQSPPGNDYRRRFAGLAETGETGLDEAQAKAPHDPHDPHSQGDRLANVSGELDLIGGGALPPGGQSGSGAVGAGAGLSSAQSAGSRRDARSTADQHTERSDLPVRSKGLSWRLVGGRLNGLTPIQLFALTILLAVVLGLVLGGVLMAAHNFLYALQRWREGWIGGV